MNQKVFSPIPFLCLLFAFLFTAESAQAQFGTTLGGGKLPVSTSATSDPKSASVGDTVSVKATLNIDPTYYVYGLNAVVDPDAFGPFSTRVALDENQILVPVADSEWTETKPKTKFDSAFETEVRYHEKTVTYTRAFNVKSLPTEGPIKLTGYIQVQICDADTCLPPKKIPFTITLNGEAAEEVAPAPTPTPAEEEDTTSMVPLEPNEAQFTVNKSSESQIEGLLSAGTLRVAGLAFLAGILSLLTPCVFPMIPLTISFFTKRASSSARERITLVGVYSGSIVLGFATIGFGLALILSLLGYGSGSAGVINAFASNPVVNITLALVFIAFAFSLFGVFEIGLPSSWANKIQQKKGNRSDVIGAMMMALIFVIISFTCTAPIVGPLIVLTVQGGILLPAVGLTFYAIGFALPFFLLGLAPSALSSLPKSGGWLNSTKIVMGLIELGVAFVYLAKADLVMQWGFFTRELILSVWVALALTTAIYLLGLFKTNKDSDVPTVGVPRLTFAIVFGSMAFYFAFGLFGGRISSDLEALLPQNGFKGSSSMNSASSNHEEPEFIMNDLAAAQALSRELNKPLFIDFTGWSCTNCQRNAIDVFPRPEVKDLMEQYVLVALYTDDREHGEKWQKYQSERFNTFSLPFYVTLTPDDEVMNTYGGLIRDSQVDEFKEFLKLGLQDRRIAMSE